MTYSTRVRTFGLALVSACVLFTKTYLQASPPIVGNASFANNAIQTESA